MLHGHCLGGDVVWADGNQCAKSSFPLVASLFERPPVLFSFSSPLQLPRAPRHRPTFHPFSLFSIMLNHHTMPLQPPSWVRGARLSELLSLAHHLALASADAIRVAHAQNAAQKHAAAARSVAAAKRYAGESGGDGVGDGFGNGSSGVASGGEIKGPLRESGGAVSGGVRVKALTDEGVAEPVTVADAASNAVLVHGYRRRFPGIALLTEEAVVEEGQEKERGENGGNDGTGNGGVGSVGGGVGSGISPRAFLPHVLPLPPGVALERDPVYPLKELLVTIDPLDATKANACVSVGRGSANANKAREAPIQLFANIVHRCQPHRLKRTLSKLPAAAAAGANLPTDGAGDGTAGTARSTRRSCCST